MPYDAIKERVKDLAFAGLLRGGDILSHPFTTLETGITQLQVRVKTHQGPRTFLVQIVEKPYAK